MGASYAGSSAQEAWRSLRPSCRRFCTRLKLARLRGGSEMPARWICQLKSLRQAHFFSARLGLDGLVTLDLQRIPTSFKFLGVVFEDQNELIRHDAPAA